MTSALTGMAGFLSLAWAAVPAPAPDTTTSGEAGLHRYEWRASTFSGSTQAEAALATDGQGNIFAVWSSRRQRDGRYGVYGQRFDADGAAVGEETCLSLWPLSHQRSPACAFDEARRLWTVWQSHGQDGAGGAIIARRFDTDGAGGSELLVNQITDGHQGDPVVAVASDGRALVVWTTVCPDGTTAVRARMLGRDGAVFGDEFPVSLPTDAWASNASVAGALGGAGGWAVAYAVAGKSRRPDRILVRLRDADEQRFGEAINVSGPLAVTPFEPVITATSSGYLVAWLEYSGPDGDYAVRARRLDGGGCAIGDPFEAGPPGAHHSGAAVAAAPDGRFAIAVNAPDGDGDGVFVRLYAADSTPLGPSLRITGHSDGTQAMRAASGTRRLAFAGDRLVCAWSGDGGFGDSSSVNLTMLSTTARPDIDRGVTPAMKAAAPPVVLATGPAPHEPPTFNARDVVAGGPRDVILGLSGIGFTGISNTGWTPPDPHMAVGPDHVVLMTNGEIAFFTKSGTLTFQNQIEGGTGFWGSLGTTNFVFDPEVLYDELSGRFFAMASESGPGQQSFALVAVSDDSDPNGAWHTYRFLTTDLAGPTFDSPNIGVDADTVYISGDGFGGPVSYPMFVYDKASLLAGNPPAVTNSFSVPTSTQSAGIPPVTYDDPPALYLVEHNESPNATTVRLIAIQNALSNPTISFAFVTVPVYGPPESPPQMGTSVRPETFDARFWSAAYRHGSLWATHHVGSSRVLVRWYEFAMNGWPDSGMMPELVQAGQVDPGPDIRTFFSAITIDEHGNAALVFSRSAPTEFISMATAFRYASDPLNTFGPDVIRQTNTGPYTVNRWGDYGAVNVDPADGITMWSHHESAVNGVWQTWVTGITPEFDPADLDFDGLVGITDFLLLLADWGACPGPPDPCPGDLDGDGEVGIVDFLQLLGSWG